MGRPARTGSSAKALAALAAVLVAGIAAALWFALGPEPDPDGGSPVVAAPGESGPGAGPARPATSRPPKPGPAPAALGFASVRGQVRLFRTREPVAGVPLALRAAEGAPLTATTDASGAFAFAGVPAGPGWELRGGREGFAPLELTGLDLAPDQALDVGVLWLAVPVDLPALVVDTTGAPVAGAEVAAFALGRTLPEEPDEWSEELRETRILSLVSNPRPSRAARTDAAGRATVAGLMPGAYRATASAPGLAPSSRSGLVLVPGVTQPVVRFVLGPGHALEGTVTDERDLPVAKARVVAARMLGELPSLDKAWADTGDDGRFRVEGLGIGPHLLYVARAGRPLLQVGRVRIPETTRFDVRLRPGGTIRGTVTGDDGKPVAGADVRVAMQDTWSPMAARTAADGTFELRDVPAGALAYFRVRAEGRVPHPEPSASQQGTGESLREGQVMVRDVVLRRGIEATVTVVDDADGPVEGAAVSVHLTATWGGEIPPWRAVTDAKGAGRVTGLLPGEHVVVVVAEGRVQTGLPAAWKNLFWAPGAIPAACRLSVAPDAPASIVVRTTRGLTVSGRVLDGAGKPAAGAVVTVDGARSEFPVFSDAEGRFAVGAVPPLRRTVARATTPGGAAGESEPFSVAGAKAAESVEIRMKDAARISGTVRTSDGGAPRAAVVRWFRGEGHGGDPSSWPGFETAERIPVAADGAFEIPGVAPGRTTVRADAEGLLPAVVAVDATPGLETGGVTLVLRAPRTIAGRVTTSGGAGVRGAAVSAEFQSALDGSDRPSVPGASGAPTAVTDAAGAFELRGLDEGTYGVFATAPGHVGGGWAEASTAAGEVRIVLEAGLSITGSVRDPDGRPLGGIPVTASPQRRAGGEDGIEDMFEVEGLGWGGGGTTVYTAPDGSFEIQDLARGVYDLRVSGSWQWGREVNVADTVKEGVAAGDRDVEVVVRQGLVIEGRVVDRAKKPVRVGWVSGSRDEAGGGSDWTSQRWVQVRPDGTFRLTGLEGGSYTVSAFGNFRSSPAAGVAAGTTDVELVTDPAQSISGVVVDERGLSLPEFQVLVRRGSDAGWNWPQVALPGDGEFVVSALEEGSYDVQVTVDGFAPAVVAGVPAGRTGLEVRIAHGLSIAGVAVDGAGRPVAGASVSVESVKLDDAGTSVSRSAATDPSGRFEVTGLLPGRYRLFAQAGNLAPCIVPNVAAGSDGLKLRFEVGTTIAGRVVGEGGAPTAQVNVLACTEDGQWVANASTGPDGTFTLTHVPSGGRWKLYVDGPDARGNWRRVEHRGRVESGAADVKIDLAAAPGQDAVPDPETK